MLRVDQCLQSGDKLATLRFFAAAKAATGVSTIEISGDTVGQVLSQATTQFPKLGIVLPKCSFLLNEVSCSDFEVQISGQDVLDVLPPFAGG